MNTGLKLEKIFFILLVGSFFSFTNNDNNYQTECISNDIDGYTTIKIWNPQKGEKYKAKQAQEDAVYAVLINGIAGTNGCTTQPPILKNNEYESKFKNIEKSFFAKNGKWLLFIRSAATETTLPTSLGKKKWKVYQVSISKKELRKYLEDHNIIKALNTGF